MIAATALLIAVIGATPHHSVNKLLDAMERVESGGRSRAVVDQGRSRGPLQIQAPYWREASKTGKVKWKYNEKVWDRDSSRFIVQSYWKKYCPVALRQGDLQTLARVHNGGPKGASKAATVPYWAKVKGKMQ